MSVRKNIDDVTSNVPGEAGKPRDYGISTVQYMQVRGRILLQEPMKHQFTRQRLSHLKTLSTPPSYLICKPLDTSTLA